MLDSEVKNFFEGNQYIPLFIMILSLIAMIMAFLPKMGVNISAPRYSVILVIVALAILVLVAVYGLGYYGAALPAGGSMGFNKAGCGVWFAVISGVLTLLVGALPAFTKKV